MRSTGPEDERVLSCDVGSLPPQIDPAVLRRGAQDVLSPGRASSSAAFEFRRAILSALRDKLAAGIDVPTYPQFRDMNEMFLSVLSGLQRLEGRFVEISRLGVHDSRIPEVLVAREGAPGLADELGLDKVRLRVCLTGPHTLSFQFAFRSPGLLTRLGRVLARIAEANLVSGKRFEVAILALDEPTFGVVDDQLVEPGSEGREALLKAWEEVFSIARSRGVLTCLHLHSTTDGLFWHVRALDMVESHVGDTLYESAQTARLLEEHDKLLRASICKTDFDALVRARVEAELPGASEPAISERLGDIWRSITTGQLDPASLLEPVDLMARRLEAVIERFGPERVPFAGPECGLRGFPTYWCAIECLRRVAEACRAACAR